MRGRPCGHAGVGRADAWTRGRRWPVDGLWTARPIRSAHAPACGGGPRPLAGQQRGLITRQQALAAGWSQDRLDRHVREGRLVRRGPGGYAGAVPQDGVAAHAQLVRARQLGKRGEWFTARRSAAVLLQLPLLGCLPALP